MATISKLLNDGLLHEYRLPDWERREAKRKLYVSNEVFDWADENPIMLSVPHGSGGRSRLEHMEQMFCDFRCAARPNGGDLRRMSPTKHGMWTMRPYKVRVYGWFCAKGEFVAMCGAIEEDTKSQKLLNDQKRDEVLGFIDKHSLSSSVLKGVHYEVF